MRRAELLIIASLATLLAGCGLVLDLDPQVDAGPVSSDAGPPRDGAPVVDADHVDAGDCSTEDVDGDGFTECDGDCDDTEENVYPGAPLVCGDGIVNDCPSAPMEDPECSGIFVATSGSDDAAGTPNDPFETIGRGVDEAHARGGGRVNIAAGRYMEDDLELRSNVELLGGLDEVTWRNSDGSSELYVTEEAGLNVANGATGVGVFVLRIESLASGSDVATVNLAAGAEALLAGCEIHATGGALISHAVRAAGFGGPPQRVEIRSSRIVLATSTQRAYGISSSANSLQVMDTVVELSGVVLDNEIGIDVFDGVADIERVFVGPAPGSGSGAVASYGIQLTEAAGTIHRSIVLPNLCQFDCAAVRVLNATSDVRLENNVFVGRGPDMGIGIGLLLKHDFLRGPPPAIEVTNNLLAGSPPNGSQFAVGAIIDAVQSSGNVEIGRFVNNAIVSGSAEGSFAFEEISLSSPLRPVEFVSNAVYRQNGDLEVYLEDSGVPFELSRLQTLGGWARGNRSEDCLFDITRFPDGIELTDGSPCIDRGRDEPRLRDDLDEIAVRPFGDGWDIGPQEFQGPAMDTP